MSTPQDPYSQQPSPGQPAYGQQPGHQPYPQQQYQGYVAPKTSFDLAKLVTIGAWVVLGLYVLDFIYRLTQDELGQDFADRFFGGMPGLGQGLFFTGVLLAVGVWLGRQQEST